MTEWLVKRSKGSFTNKLVLRTKDDMERKTRMVDNLVVYYGSTTSSNEKTVNKGQFKLYEEVAKDFMQ